MLIGVCNPMPSIFTPSRPSLLLFFFCFFFFIHAFRLYTLLIGWWLAAVYIILGSVLWMTLIAQDYTPLCWDLASYFFWPFGKYVVLLGKPYESPVFLTWA